MAEVGTEANRAVALGCLEAFSRGDIRGVAAMMRPDARWIVMGQLAGMSGEYARDEFVTLAEGARENYRTRALAITPLAITAEGDRVAIEAKGHAELLDGRTYAPDYHLLFRIEDGMIAEVREYMDTHHAFEIFF